MIVTIDGPAGAGKSSAARALARRMGFWFLDTGAMYRAVAFAAERAGIDWNAAAELAALARRVTIELDDDRVLLDGEDVTRQIRAAAVTAITHHAAGNAEVRSHLVELQRAEAARHHHVVTEGRDQGTVVFPAAECKIFLTASPEERARRRQRDLDQRGERLGFEEVLEAQNLRDQRDEQRQVGPLVAADDAVTVNTDGLSEVEVVDRLEALVRSRMPAGESHSSSD